MFLFMSSFILRLTAHVNEKCCNRSFHCTSYY